MIKRLYGLWIFVMMAGYTYSQQSPLEFSMKYSAPRGSGSSFLNTGVSIALPIYKNDKTIIFTGVSYDWYSIHLPDDSIGVNNLHRFSIPVGFIFKLENNYRFNVVFDPSISSDMEDISSSDFRFNAAVRLQKVKQTGISWSIGIGFSKQFFGLQITPFYQTVIPITHRLTLSGALPIKPKLTWHINDNRQWGFAVGGDSNSFRLSEGKQGRYADIKQLELNAFYQQKLIGNFRITGSIGYVFINRFRVFDNDQTIPLRLFLCDFGHSRTPVASWSNRGLSFQVQIAWIFNNDQN